jgi:hypothetical protein
MNPDFSLINPPIMLKTQEKLITVASDKDEAYLDLTSIQPKLYKRLTRKRKEAHLQEITNATVDLFQIKSL